mgnify:CR=1 FL=1
MLFPDFATLAHPRARGGIGGLRPRALRRRSWCLLAVCWGVAQLLAGPGVALPQEGSPGASRPATKSAPAFEFDPKPLAAIDHLMEEAIARHDCPGGVLWIEHAGVVHTRAYGRRAVVPKPEPMTPDTLFDAASLTKALATTPSILILFDRGKLDLEAPVARYLPRFQGEGRERVTLRHLLTHTSGHPRVRVRRRPHAEVRPRPGRRRASGRPHPPAMTMWCGSSWRTSRRPRFCRRRRRSSRHPQFRDEQ